MFTLVTQATACAPWKRASQACEVRPPSKQQGYGSACETTVARVDKKADEAMCCRVMRATMSQIVDLVYMITGIMYTSKRVTRGLVSLFAV
jgi:hypothetical protein